MWKTTLILKNLALVIQHSLQGFILKNIEYESTGQTILVMHLSAVIPGTYRGIARDLLPFVANVWPGRGALDRFCTSEARYMGKDPRDL